MRRDGEQNFQSPSMVSKSASHRFSGVHFGEDAEQARPKEEERRRRRKSLPLLVLGQPRSRIPRKPLVKSGCCCCCSFFSLTDCLSVCLSQIPRDLLCIHRSRNLILYRIGCLEDLIDLPGCDRCAEALEESKKSSERIAFDCRLTQVLTRHTSRKWPTTTTTRLSNRMPKSLLE